MGADDAIRVLIADGDASLRQQLNSALVLAGVSAHCTNNCEQAIDTLHERDYSVIVLDVDLPGGAVGQVVSAIAAQRTLPVVIVLAGPDAAHALDVDIAQIILRRPVRLTQIVDIIRSCARERPRQPQLTS